jgi:hypothetical protein
MQSVSEPWKRAEAAACALLRSYVGDPAARALRMQSAAALGHPLSHSMHQEIALPLIIVMLTEPARHRRTLSLDPPLKCGVESAS